MAVPPVTAAVWAATMASGTRAGEPASWVVLVAAACFLTGLHARRLAGLVSFLAALAISGAALRWFDRYVSLRETGQQNGPLGWAAPMVEHRLR